METIDWKVMENGAKELFDKSYILYGASSVGNQMFAFLELLNLKKNVIAVFDSDERKWGSDFHGFKIQEPACIHNYDKDAFIVITSTFVKEIVENLRDTYKCKQKYVLSSCAFRLAFHYDIMNDRAFYLQNDVVKEYQKKYEAWHEDIQEKHGAKNFMNEGQKAISKYLEPILMCGIPKTGNMTLVKSLQNYENAVFTWHLSYNNKENFEKLKQILEENPTHKVRIISGIREPFERIISQVWQLVSRPYIGHDRCFNTIIDKNYDQFPDYHYSSYEKRLLKGAFWHYADIKAWFDDQIKVPFGIDIFEHPFDKEKGYSIVENGNISIFTYRLDKLSNLGKELGEFLGISDFAIQKDNVAKNKSYAIAYAEYKDAVRIKSKFFTQLVDSSGMTHFYTKEEIDAYRKKWEDKLL